jgi:hypothetical protein
MAHAASIVRISPGCRIESSEWVQFAKSHPCLVLETIEVPAATAVHIDGPRNLRIFWSDGRICCGAPTRQLIEIMFECAERLGGVVIGPRHHQYTSIEDWEARTLDSRERESRSKDASRRAHQRKRISVLAILLIALFLGVLIRWLINRQLNIK